MRHHWITSCLAVSLCATSIAATARAQSAALPEDPTSFGSQLKVPEAGDATRRLVWNPKWPRFRAVGYALTSASIAGALAATFLIPYPEEPRWVAGILFDSAVRSDLRARSPALLDATRHASDFTLMASLLYTGLVDGIVVPAVDGSWDIAWQLTLMNVQAVSLNILVATVLFKAVARARPTYVECEADQNSDPLCDTGEFASFPSSHTSTAFTAAGLTCVHHANLPLYGGEPWDTAACAGSIVLAAATGMFRIIGDRHYFTDVVIGAAFGFSLGYLYPWLLHYRYGRERDPIRGQASGLRWGVTPGTARSPIGASLLGQF